jgi:DNA-binding transcriptional MerR regulator
MTNQKLYSLQEIAKRLNIPPATVSYYRKNYADFMPSVRVKGKKYPMFEAQAIDVVGLVRELANNGKLQHEINDVLTAKYPAVIDNSSQNTTNEQSTNEQSTTILATIQQQPNDISKLINLQTDLIKGQNATLEGYKHLVEEKEAEITRLRAQLVATQPVRTPEQPQKSQTKPATAKPRRKPKTKPTSHPEKPIKQGGWLSKLFN